MCVRYFCAIDRFVLRRECQIDDSIYVTISTQMLGVRFFVAATGAVVVDGNMNKMPSYYSSNSMRKEDTKMWKSIWCYIGYELHIALDLYTQYAADKEIVV